MEQFLRYIYSEGDFFKDCLDEISEKDIIEVKHIPLNWEKIVSEDKIWINYYPKGIDLDNQGWKLHISASYKDMKRVLDVVSDVMFDFNIPFKNIYTKQMFHIMHSKNADRITAGKFITIYPNYDKLKNLIETLYDKLVYFDKACYILSDKRYKDSNIYYRYGAFKNMIVDNKYCIKSPSGEYIEDLRKPYFIKPSFVNVPDFLLNQKDKENTDESTKLSEYTMERAIKFSASGGIYYATRKSDGKKVVIKEARNAIGIDSEGITAIERLRNEYNTLKLVKNYIHVVDVIEYFKVWENEYLVEELLDGVPLTNWLAINYPFSTKKDKKEYLIKVNNIMQQIERAVDYIHDKGIGISDLQPNNIIIDNNLQCKLIDFESSGDINRSYYGMGTHGFSMGISNRKENDISAKENILKYLLLPIAPIVSLDSNITNLHFDYINKLYGDTINEFFKDYAPNIKFNKNIEVNFCKIKGKLIDGLKINLNAKNKIFAYGDVYSYLNKGGHFNYITGGVGIIYTLYLDNNLNDDCHEWIQNNYCNFRQCNFGLLDGQMGICNVLEIIGHNNLADEIIANIDNNLDHIINSNDISIYSGIAGMILGYISLFNLKKDKVFIEKAVKLSRAMINRIDLLLKDTSKNKLLFDFVHGLSGCVFSLLVLYDIIKDEKLYSKSKEYLHSVIEYLYLDKESDILQLKLDDNRILPYLENGSIGVALNMYFLANKFNDYEFKDYFKYISNTMDLSIFYDASLFFGMGSKLIMASMIDDLSKCDCDNLLDLIKLYIVQRDNNYFIPGRSAMKLSNDIYTGSSGIILGINALMEKNPFLWLPIKL